MISARPLPSAILSGFSSPSKPEEAFLRTSIPSIDHVLTGGLRTGEVVSIADEDAAERTLIALHLVAGVLVASECHEVVFVDTKGTFDPHQLLGICASHLRVQRPSSVDKQREEEASSWDMRALERVRLMRVFDDAGLLDALKETHDACCIPSQLNIVIDKGLEDDDSLGSQQRCSSHLSETSMVPDNQSSKIQLVVIDNIASVIAPQLSKNQLHGQAILASCGRYFSAIARSSRASILVLNTTTQTAKASRANDKGGYEGVSTFQSIPDRPSLGRGFTKLIDLSIQISTFTEPLDTVDDSAEDSNVRILEVLADHKGDRAGRWTVI